MDYAGFITTVEQEAQIAHDLAERATRATLTTLGERLSAGEARDVAEQLPRELRDLLMQDSKAQPFYLDEFLRRIAEREGAQEPTQAEAHARAVFAALGAAVSLEELEDMASELPKDFEPFVAVAEQRAAVRDAHPRMSADEFLSRVADRAGLDPDGARRATEAVLEALGHRISRGEVEDLAAQLPPELHAPLRKGDAASNGAAQPLSLSEFLAIVAEREGVTPDEAREHTRAVFATLREAVSDKEFADMTAQLPREYRAVLARGG